MKKLITLAGYICLFTIVFAGRVWAQTISSDLTLTSVFRPTGLGILNETVPNIVLNDGYVLVVKGDSTPTPAPSPSPTPIQSVTPTTIPAPTEFEVPSSMTTKRDLSSLNILQASGVSDRSKISAHTLVDDGYVIFFKYAGGSDDQKTTVVKYDFNHNLVWKKTVVSTFTHNSTADAWSVYPEFSHAITLNNGNIVAAGIKQTSDEFGSYYYLVQVKFDENGNQSWFKAQNVGSSFALYSLAATSDGGYIITSKLGDKSTLTKYDSSGDVDASYTYNESALSFDGDTIVLDNGGYLTVGAMPSMLKVGSGNYYKVYNIRMTQINSQGEIAKSYDYESIYVSEKPHKIILVDDGYVIVGESEINANAAVDVKAGTLSSDTYNYYRDHTGSLLLKINADNGQIVWKKYYATNGSGWSDVIKTDRGYVTVGTLHRNYNYPSGDITNISGISEINSLFPYSYWYLMGLFDEDGNRKWIKVFSDSISDTKSYNSTDRKLQRIYDLKDGNLLGIGKQVVTMSVLNSPTTQSTTADKHLYRFWSKTFNGHFFTTSYEEALGVANNDYNWQYEHVGYDVNDCTDANSFKVYRFWSDNYHGHFYTMSEQEKNSVIANDKNWRYEGEVFCVFTSDSGSGTKPVYRFWSDNFRHHFYTSDVAERDFTIKYDKNWRYEGEAWRIKGENYQASTTKKVKSALMASKMNYPANTVYTREIDQSVLDGKAKETSTAEATSEATIETAHLISSPPVSESATIVPAQEKTENVQNQASPVTALANEENEEQEITLVSDETQTEEVTATSEAEINV